DDRFGNAIAAADLTDLSGQLGLFEKTVERFFDAPDLGPDLCDGLVPVRFAPNMKPQIRGKRLDRLDPERKRQVEPGERVVVERIEGGKLRDMIGNAALLLEPAPVLVLALEHGLQAGRRQAELAAKNRRGGADRKVEIVNQAIDDSRIGF